MKSKEQIQEAVETLERAIKRIDNLILEQVVKNRHTRRTPETESLLEMKNGIVDELQIYQWVLD